MTTENINNTENAESAENIDGLGLSDRGIAAQAWGFGIIGCISVATLHLFSSSDYALYHWFETAATQLYWAFVVPLAALIEWGRNMFAKGKAIREAKLREIRQAGVQEGIKQGIEQGIQQGVAQGIRQGRQQSNAKWRALAEKYGIPESELPFTDDDA